MYHIWTAMMGLTWKGEKCKRLGSSSFMTLPVARNRTSNHSVQFSHSVMSELFKPMDCSMPDFPVHHQPPELTQTHVRWFGDAIPPAPPLLFPSPSAFNLSQHQYIFQWVSTLPQWPKVWSFSISISISPFNECSRLVESPCTPKNSQESSPTP